TPPTHIHTLSLHDALPISPTSAPFTGEDQGPYKTQDVVNPSLLVKDHSESDIRVDPKDPNHLIGQSKWIVNAEGYNHLLGFYERSEEHTSELQSRGHLVCR